MPQHQSFYTENDYFSTLLHEIIHATGAPHRINRASLKAYSTKKGRAEEELVAEIGSVFLATHFSVCGDLINHASYVSDWKESLTPKEIARAVSQASKAFHWIISQSETA